MLDVNALVVDDSRTARMVLKNRLNQLDVVVESAPDGGHALDMLRDHQPDVIFLDHVMPGLDGFQVLLRLKENLITRNIPVVMYTSQAAPQYVAEAKSLGAIAVIPKNVTDEELADALGKAEMYRLTAANDDYRDISSGDDPGNAVLAKEVASRARAGASVTPFPASAVIKHEQAQLRPVNNKARAVEPVAEAVDDYAYRDASEAVGSSIPEHAEAEPQPVRYGLILLLLALLTITQGYSILHQRQQQETISDLREQVLQQERKLPQLRTQLLNQQQQLAERISQQMAFLITILSHQTPTESTAMADLPLAPEEPSQGLEQNTEQEAQAAEHENQEAQVSL